MDNEKLTLDKLIQTLKDLNINPVEPLKNIYVNSKIWKLLNTNLAIPATKTENATFRANFGTVFEDNGIKDGIFLMMTAEDYKYYCLIRNSAFCDINKMTDQEINTLVAIMKESDKPGSHPLFEAEVNSRFTAAFLFGDDKYFK